VWKDAQLKILILKPSSLGDVIQALPVLRLLKLHLPASEIHWWLQSELTTLLHGDPDLAGIIPFERRNWGATGYWFGAWRGLRAMRRHHFDWVIDLQSLARSGLVAWLANGDLTVGMDDHREGARAFYDLIVRRGSWDTHAVDWYLKVLPALGVPTDRRFVWMPERPNIAETVRAKWQPAAKRWIVLQPGARWRNKRWPVEHFARLVGEDFGWADDVRFAILGSTGERELGRAIATANPRRCLDLSGNITLPEMVEWIRLGELTITNDTGPMHVAAALGKPLIALFGPTEPRRTGPYNQFDCVLRHPLPCAPCMRDTCDFEKPLECLRALTPEHVLERVPAALRQR
jgi:lipopolysaccharide heptosyltransferase II